MEITLQVKLRRTLLREILFRQLASIMRYHHPGTSHWHPKWR